MKEQIKNIVAAGRIPPVWTWARLAFSWQPDANAELRIWASSLGPGNQAEAQAAAETAASAARFAAAFMDLSEAEGKDADYRARMARRAASYADGYEFYAAITDASYAVRQYAAGAAAQVAFAAYEASGRNEAVRRAILASLLP